MPTQGNQQLSRYKFSKVIECLVKSIAKDYRIPKKRTESKIFELKNGNTKLLRNTKYNHVKLVLAVFASAFLYLVNIKSYKLNTIT